MAGEYQTVHGRIRTHDGEHGPADVWVGEVDGQFMLDSRVIGTCGIGLDRAEAAGFLDWLSSAGDDEDIVIEPHLRMPDLGPAGCVTVLERAARVQVRRLLAGWLRGERS
jgi:hypothetical protein